MARILVVEDDDTLLGVVSEFLDGLGHDTLRASSGREAIHLLTVEESPVDLALVDWQMAGINGRGVVDHIRRECPRTEVLVSTGLTPRHVTRTSAGRHARAILRKPFSLRQLALTIDQVLNPST